MVPLLNIYSPSLKVKQSPAKNIASSFKPYTYFNGGKLKCEKNENVKIERDRNILIWIPSCLIASPKTLPNHV